MNRSKLNESSFLQPAVEKAQLHALHGDQLIQSNHYAVDSIRPKCVELRRVCDDFSNEAKKKSEILSKSLQIHLGIDKVRMHSVLPSWIIFSNIATINFNILLGFYVIDTHSRK